MYLCSSRIYLIYQPYNKVRRDINLLFFFIIIIIIIIVISDNSKHMKDLNFARLQANPTAAALIQ